MMIIEASGGEWAFDAEKSRGRSHVDDGSKDGMDSSMVFVDGAWPGTAAYANGVLALTVGEEEAETAEEKDAALLRHAGHNHVNAIPGAQRWLRSGDVGRLDLAGRYVDGYKRCHVNDLNVAPPSYRLHDPKDCRAFQELTTHTLNGGIDDAWEILTSSPSLLPPGALGADPSGGGHAAAAARRGCTLRSGCGCGCSCGWCGAACDGALAASGDPTSPWAI